MHVVLYKSRAKAKEQIMRKVTEQSIKAFLNHRNGKFGGVCTNSYAGCGYGEINTEVDNGGLYLFGNCIAKLKNNDLYVRIHTLSNTTRERLNGFSEFGYKLSVSQKDWQAYINGEKVEDYYKWYKVERV